jgi:Abnormal spindle-like microcephaly-assoc'd, ASPM-SPD-2-Hydin
MEGAMRSKSTAGICGPRRVRGSIVRRGGVPLATIGIVMLLSGILAAPAAAVPTPIEVSPLALDFGAVKVGATSPQMSVQVKNTSTSPFGPINMFGGAPPTTAFNASQNCQGVTLAGGASCQISYTFSPTAPGPASDFSGFTISPTTNQADGEDFSVTLTGCGLPCIEVSPSVLDFGDVNVGATSPQMSVQVTNRSTSPFGPINIFGGAPITTAFNASSQNCQGATLAGGASCQISYTFSPTAPGPASDSSNFIISPTGNLADGGAFSVALTGRGLSLIPPTFTSFTPTSGGVGTSVVITGTRFLGTSAVEFNGVSATFTVDSDTQITATVPEGATTGPITATTSGGTATSATDFTVTAPAVRHTRTITLELRKRLVARGRVAAADGFAECESGATVKIQHRRKGSWRTIDTDVTGPAGRYRESLPDRAGKYRAVVKKRVLNDGADVCRRDVSPVRRHTLA